LALPFRLRAARPPPVPQRGQAREAAAEDQQHDGGGDGDALLGPQEGDALPQAG